MILLVLLVLAGQPGQAAEINLGRVFKYSILAYKHFMPALEDPVVLKTVKDLAPGDFVTFSDGKRFQLDKKIGTGGSAVIWGIVGQPEVLIRIPHGRNHHIKLMESYRIGWEQIKALGFPIVQILDPANHTLEYQLVERLHLKFTFEQWKEKSISPNLYPRKIPPALYDRAFQELEALVLTSSHIAEIRDMLQMGFDGNKWVLYDFVKNNGHFQAHPDYRTATVWEEENLRPDMYEKFVQMVMVKRAQMLTESGGAVKVCRSVHAD